MQEVQTTLDYKAELNLIEWVWHQENKIKEHTQVESAFGYCCTVSWSASYYASRTERESTTNQWPFSITDSYWVTEFLIKGWELRIPLAWPYLAQITLEWWSSTATITNYIKSWDRIIYQLDTTSTSPVTDEVVLNLGRFDMLSFWGKMYYSWSADGATAWSTATIKLKRL